MKELERNLELKLKLRDYIKVSKIPIVFINFEKSLIMEKYSGKNVSKDYQILVLEKPDPFAFEIEPLQWSYSAKKVLLIYNCISEEVSFIPLEFSFKLADGDVENNFNFYYYHSLKIRENHILITTLGQELNGGHRCLDIALFETNGRLVSVWQTENCNGYKNSIDDFHQLQPSHWIANLKFDEKIQYKPAVHRLCLLSLNQSEAIKGDILSRYWNVTSFRNWRNK